ncbi:MAG: hypothetical protein WCF85_14225 [Rhodospirillaceae bacterium]
MTLSTPEFAEPTASPMAKTRLDAPIRFVRRIPVGWRISLLVMLNLAVCLIVAGLIWRGSHMLEHQWAEVQRITEDERLIDAIDNGTSRLHSLIHRYLRA